MLKSHYIFIIYVFARIDRCILVETGSDILEAKFRKFSTGMFATSVNPTIIIAYYYSDRLRERRVGTAGGNYRWWSHRRTEEL